MGRVDGWLTIRATVIQAGGRETDRYGFKVKAFSAASFKKKRKPTINQCLFCRKSAELGRKVCKQHGG